MRRLEEISAQLRDLPRHRWDEHLWRYCERLVDDAGRRAPRGHAKSGARDEARRRLRVVGSPA